MRITLKTKTGDISGSLLVPEVEHQVPVALIIAGSGPTDRDGNPPGVKNDSLKILAEALQQNGIASVRYDKRGISESRGSGLEESALSIDHYIADATEWISLLDKDKRFNQVVVIGHSEGSMVGMVASRRAQADKFISLAGNGRTLDKLLLEQLNGQSAELAELAAPVLRALAQGNTLADVPDSLVSLFRPSVQPFFISVLQYDPVVEFGKLNIPSLVVQGSTDIQIMVKDAKMLSAANSRARLEIIQGMNHILKVAPEDRDQNIATYSESSTPLHPGLIGPIVEFIF